MEFISLKNDKEEVHVTLNLATVTFKENDYWIVYCPSLDLAGSGNDLSQAKESFKITLEMTLDYCAEENTLNKMLVKLGWMKKPLSTTAKFVSNRPFQSRIDSNRYLKKALRTADTYEVNNNFALSY